MTAAELKHYFNTEYGISKQWPATFEVDHETYANVCQEVFSREFESDVYLFWDNTVNGEKKSSFKFLSVAIGENKGIMFNFVELILKAKNEKASKDTQQNSQ
jgi:hypothetical protein